MYVEKETDHALLMVHEAVSFWIKKRWLRSDWSLTPAGWKSYHIARKKHWQYFGFDALKEFEVERETEKAVLLRCTVYCPDGTVKQEVFWIPKSMTDNHAFVAMKVREVEDRHPFIGTRVKLSGGTAVQKPGNYPQGERGSAISVSGGLPIPSNPERPGDFI